MEIAYKTTAKASSFVNFLNSHHEKSEKITDIDANNREHRLKKCILQRDGTSSHSQSKPVSALLIVLQAADQ
jgi:hypothetical protein